MTAARAASLARLGWIAARSWSLLVTVLAGIAWGNTGRLPWELLGLALAPWALTWVWQGRLALRRP